MQHTSIYRSLLLATAGLVGVACAKKTEPAKSESSASSQPASAPAAAAAPAEAMTLAVGEMGGESGGIKASKLAGSKKFPEA